jgi:hypothetical protein
MPEPSRTLSATSPPGTSAKPGGMPLLFAPTIGTALAARYRFLSVAPRRRSTFARSTATATWRGDQSLSCRLCRPNAPFAELLRLSPTSIANEIRAEHGRQLRKP